MESAPSFWSRNSITIKLVIIGILTLLLLIPSSMIQNLIREREQTRNGVISEINSKWGNAQTLVGPIISVPYKKYFKKDKELVSTIKYAHFLPDSLEINGEIDPEIRYRGIYKVIVYNSNLRFSGGFTNVDPTEMEIDEKNILWDQAVVYVGIPDMRGINRELSLNINGSEYDVNPGIPVDDIVKSGVSSKINISKDKKYTFDFTLDLNGSETLNFIPVGKTTNVNITSNWTTPSFSGSFLPDKRDIDENGFTAKWNVLHLNRNYPQNWIDDAYSLNDSSFGLNLLFPVDQYQKADRSVKYAIMFIALTFLAFFFSETLNRVKIHPIQYLLVGIALVIFYSLLISLSEHIGFGWAYLISSIMIVTLITLYYNSILKNRKSTTIIGLIMISLYVFLFTIIQLQDYSLLMGSIGLFVVIAVIMYLSKNIDWYSSINIRKKIE